MIVSSTSLPPLPLLSPVPPLPRSASTSGITSAPLLVGACMVNEMGIGRGNKGLSLSVTLGFCMVHNFGIGLGNKCNGLRFGIFMTRFMLCNRFMRCVRRMRCNCVWLAPCCRKSAIALATICLRLWGRPSWSLVLAISQMEKMQKWKMELLQFSWARVVGFQSFYVGPQYATTIKKSLPGLYIYVLFYRASSAGCQQMLARSYIYSKVSILLAGIYSDPTSMVEVHHPLVTYQASNPQFDQTCLKWTLSSRVFNKEISLL